MADGYGGTAVMFTLAILTMMAIGGAVMLGPQFRYWLIVVLLLFFVVCLN